MLIPVEKHASFAKDGFQFARSLVGAEELSKVLKSIVTHTHSGKSSDDAASTTWSAHHIYSEGTDYLLEKLAPKVSELVGSSLLPTCAYVQIYKKGGILPLHVDIPECEVTVTITLDYDSKALWPLFFIADQVVTATLDRGDALVFDATRFLHGRKAFEGESWTQATLHYVTGMPLQRSTSTR